MTVMTAVVTAPPRVTTTAHRPAHPTPTEVDKAVRKRREVELAALPRTLTDPDRYYHCLSCKQARRQDKPAAPQPRKGHLPKEQEDAARRAARMLTR
jgi:hypothetical protein